MDSTSVQMIPQANQMLDFAMLAVQATMLALIVERAVAVFKHLTKIDWRRPWVLVSFLLSWGICQSHGFHLIEGIVQGVPGPALMFFPGTAFDCFISAAVICGGSAGIVSMVKKMAEQRQEIHATKLGGARPEPEPV